MLGCHDFNGYYEWTFHFLRRTYGVDALQRYWTEAIASDSQQHYVTLGRELGLRGLYQAWAKTGVDEKCDWEVTLHEEENVLRLDMYSCPSKGFLLKHDLNADEDYCDHCIGWIGPALVQIGAEVSMHEHNHCGQCWWEMRLVDRESQPIAVTNDARATSDWEQGYLHRFVQHKLQRSVGEHVDSCEKLVNWFEAAKRIVVLGSSPTEGEKIIAPRDGVIMTLDRFLVSSLPESCCTAVVLNNSPDGLPLLADRYDSLPEGSRPLLLFAYLPNSRQAAVEHGLPRPTPLLPFLIRSGCYIHQPDATPPSPTAFAILLAAALSKPGTRRDIEIDASAIETERWCIDAAHIARPASDKS